MATNRKRTKRTPKSAIPKNISKQYRGKLILKDFMGELEDHEIPVAGKAGVLVWDLWVKAKKVATLTGDLHRKGWRLAPVFDGNGNPDTKRYPEKHNFLVKSYADLEAKMAEK
jgi:hypothetical protein